MAKVLAVAPTLVGRKIFAPAEPDAVFFKWAMSKHTRSEVGAILEDELRLRRAAYVTAKKEFEQTTGGATGLPHPDGTLHIKNVGATHLHALQAYRGRFVTHGEVPARFQE
jgi:hypothetical protein